MFTFIRNSFGDQYFHEVNGISFNKLGALNTLSKRFDEILLKEESIYIIVGTDSGLIPTYLLHKGVPSDSVYIFIETNQLYPVIKKVIPDHPQLHLCTVTNWSSLAAELNLPLYIQANCTYRVDSIAVSTGHHSPYAELAAAVKEEFNSIVATTLKNAELFDFFNIGLINLSDNQNSISSLIEDHSSDTAIILGAGPSLDQHIKWIKENSPRLHIFCVSRIANKLKSEGIVPDYIVTVDSQDFSYEIGKDSFQFENHATLIHSFHANSLLVGQWLGNKAFTGDRIPWRSAFNDDCIPQNGTTVTNIAFDAAVTIGFKNILLAGVDFCHSPDGFTHATSTGTKTERAPTLHHELFVHVENNRGEIVETTTEFKNAGIDFSKHAETASSNGVTVTNLSDTAMKMDNIIYTDYKNITLSSRKKALSSSSKMSARQFYLDALKELNKAKTELNKLSRYAKEAINKNQNLFDKNGLKNTKIDKQLTKLDRKLYNNNNPFVPLIKIIGLRQSLKYLRATRSKDHAWSHSEITESNIAHLTTFFNNSERLIKTINRSIQRIKSRQLELSASHKHIKPLLTQWINDKHPRRAVLFKKPDWSKLHSSKEDEHLKKELTNIEKEINSPIPRPESSTTAKINNSFSTIRHYAQNNNLYELQNYHKKLSLQPNTGNKTVFLSLCSGLIEHLKDNKQKSFEILTNLLGENGKFNEDQLEYILAKVSMIALELKDYTNAKVALETLSQTFSPSYTPKYAELLYMTGEINKALETYEHYISQYPDDLDTVFCLAELQRKENHIEPAKALYEYILLKKPDYSPAAHRINQISHN